MIIPTPLVPIFTLRCSSRIVKLHKTTKARAAWPNVKRRGPVPVSAMSVCGGTITVCHDEQYGGGSWFWFRCSICDNAYFPGIEQFRDDHDAVVKEALMLWAERKVGA